MWYAVTGIILSFCWAIFLLNAQLDEIRTLKSEKKELQQELDEEKAKFCSDDWLRE